MSHLSMAEEVVLLAYDNDGSARSMGTYLDYGLAGALLLELALAGRIGVVGRQVVVFDPTPTGDDLVDAALGRIAGDRRARSPRGWIPLLSKGLRPAVLDRLVRAGVLQRDADTVLWVFPRTRYPSPTGVEPPAETEARQRMRAAVTGNGPVDPRTAALCALVTALRWDRRLFSDVPRRQVKSRLNEIRQGAWAADAVKNAIDEVQAAVVATTVAASVVATGS